MRIMQCTYTHGWVVGIIIVVVEQVYTWIRFYIKRLDPHSINRNNSVLYA